MKQQIKITKENSQLVKSWQSVSGRASGHSLEKSAQGPACEGRRQQAGPAPPGRGYVVQTQSQSAGGAGDSPCDHGTPAHGQLVNPVTYAEQNIKVFFFLFKRTVFLIKK